MERWGEPDLSDVIAGTIMVLLVLEAGRRVIGGFLPGLCVALIVYALLGPYFPGILKHPGVSYWDTASWLYSTEAIYGSITRVFASFVFLFVVLGTALEQSGGRNIFINLSAVEAVTGAINWKIDPTLPHARRGPLDLASTSRDLGFDAKVGHREGIRRILEAG